MAGIIGGILGGFARPMTMRAPQALAAVGATPEQSASGERSNLPVAIVPPPPTGRSPIAYDLFVNQFTTPSTAAVASDAFAAAEPDHQSLTELRAHAAYSAIAAKGI